MTPEELASMKSLNEAQAKAIRDDIAGDELYRAYLTSRGSELVSDFTDCLQRFNRIFEVVDFQPTGPSDLDRKTGDIVLQPVEHPSLGWGDAVAQLTQQITPATSQLPELPAFFTRFEFRSHYARRLRAERKEEKFSDTFGYLIAPPETWSREHLGEALRFHEDKITRAIGTLVMLEAVVGITSAGSAVEAG